MSQLEESNSQQNEIPLNDACSLMFNLTKKHNFHMKSLQIPVCSYEYRGSSLEKFMKNHNYEDHLPFNNVAYISEDEFPLQIFMCRIVLCKKERFIEWRNYFRHPIRYEGKKKECLILMEPLDAFRVLCHSKEKRRQSSLNRKFPWIEIMMQKAFGKILENENKFYLDEDLAFTLENMLYSNEKSRIIGFCFESLDKPEAIDKVLFAFPSMLIHKAALNPNESINEKYCCFAVQNKQDGEAIICTGHFTKQENSNEISIELDFSRCDMHTEPKCVLFGRLAEYIQSTLSEEMSHFAMEAIKYGELFKTKEGIEKIANAVSQVSSRKAVLQPTEKHKQNVKSRSENILRDVTNIYQSLPTITKIQKKEIANANIEKKNEQSFTNDENSIFIQTKS